jgi:hypothetical protein
MEAAGQARATADDHGYPWGRGAARRLQAVLAAHDGDDVEAERLWQSGMEVFVPRGDLDEGTLVVRAAARRALGRGDRALAAMLVASAPRAPFGPGRDDLAELADIAPAAEPGVERRPPLARAEVFRLACAVLAGQAMPLGELPEPVSPAEPRAGARGAPAGSLRRAGDVWVATWAGETVHVRHRKGLDDLAVLLARPGEQIHCLELMGGADVGGESGPAVDGRARREYEARVRQLQQQIDEARDAGEERRLARAEEELDALVQELSRAFGLGGRARGSGSAVERARAAVTWRLRSAVRQIDTLHPQLGRHLANAVRTGTWCSYRPETAVDWETTPETSPPSSPSQPFLSR